MVSYELLWRKVVEHPRINEVLHNFGGADTIHWCRLGHLLKPVCEDQEMLVLPQREDKWNEDFDERRRQWLLGWKELKSLDIIL